jgi:hypothetical protein
MSRKLSASFLPHKSSAQVSFSPDQRERMLQWVGEVKGFLDINEKILRRTIFAEGANGGSGGGGKGPTWNGCEWMSSFMQSLDQFERQANKTACEAYSGDVLLLAQCSATLVSLICHVSDHIVEQTVSLLQKIPTILQEVKEALDVDPEQVDLDVGQVKVDLDVEGGADGTAENNAEKINTVALPLLSSASSVTSARHRCASIVAQLFRALGTDIEPVVVVLVSSLEPYYFHPRSDVQDLSISAVSSIIAECSVAFVENHGLSAVWNLYFLLESFVDDSEGLAFPSRPCKAICDALSALAPLYVANERTLTFQILNKMMCLGNKSVEEEASISSCLKNIFRLVADIDEDSKRYSMVPMFLSLLSTHHEQQYDLLHSALMAYYLISFHPRSVFQDPAALKMYDDACSNSGDHVARRQANGTDLRNRRNKHAANLAMLSASAQEAVECPPVVSIFTDSLLQHFQAASELVRYGAALCLHASLLIYGGHVWAQSAFKSTSAAADKHREIVFHVITGCFDKSWYMNSICLDLLELLILFTNDVQLLLDIREHRKFYNTHVSLEKQVNLSGMIVRFVDNPTISPFTPREIGSLVGGLQFMEFEDQARRLNIVSSMASNVLEVDSTVLHNFFPYLLFGRDGTGFSGEKNHWHQQSEGGVAMQNKRSLQIQTLTIFQKLESSIRKAPVDLLDMLDSYLNQLVEQHVAAIMRLEADQPGETDMTGSGLPIIMSSMDIISKMPYKMLKNSKFEVLLITFKRGLLFSRSAELRLKALTTLSTMRDIWEPSAVHLQMVLSMVILCLGDLHAPCRQLATDILLKSAGILPPSLVIVLENDLPQFREVNPAIPIRHYKKIAEELHIVQLSAQNSDHKYPDLCNAVTQLVAEEFLSSLPDHVVPPFSVIDEKEDDPSPLESTYSSRNFTYWVVVLYAELELNIPQLLLRNVDILLQEYQSSRHDFRSTAVILGPALCVSVNAEGAWCAREYGWGGNWGGGGGVPLFSSTRE